MRWVLFSFLFACVVNTGYSQESNAQDRHRFVVIPSDQGLILIAPQPDCPLKFEDIKLLANMKGLWIPGFKLRNHGSKPIRAFTVAAPGNGEWGWRAPDSLHYVMPGQIAPLLEDSNDEIVPLTESLRDRLNLRGPMKGILALVVVQVEFADGSSFSERGYDALKDYFERLYLGNAKKKSARH